MTTLSAALANYLRIRRSESVQFKKVGPALEHFVEFLEENDAQHVTVELAVEWAVLATHASDRHRANRLTMVRGFAAYLRTLDPAHEVPPWGLLPSGKPRTDRPRGHSRDVDRNGTAASATSATDGRLRAALADYLRIRRALGYKLTKDERALRGFVEFLEAKGAQRVTIELALDWVTLPEAGASAYLANRLTMVRQFGSYLRTIDPATEVPPGRLLRAGKRRATPYVYSDREIAALIDAAALLRYPLLAATYRTLIGLLAVSGLRVGEAIRLDLDDIDWERGLLVIRASKFGKTRLVPLHPTAMDALEDYLQRRGGLYPCPVPSAPAVFISAAGTRLIYNSVNFTFLKLARHAGLRPRSPTCRPRGHDLRHTFAVRSVLDGYHGGGDVQPRLSVLSTYLGHVNPSSTYWYLSAAPELLQLAGERLQRHLNQLGDRT
jgi:integrase/recombinase XerD